MDTRTKSQRMRCLMTVNRAKEYYEDLKTLFLKKDSDWTDKAKSVRTIAHNFYLEITGADKDCSYASAIRRCYPNNSATYKKAEDFKDELNDIIHSNKIISRKDYLAIYNSFVQQISFATKVFPDQKTLDLLCKHHKESPLEKESRFCMCINKAIDNKQKVRLYGYSSSHSDSKVDRTIEPIEFICEGRSIWAYEEKQDGTGVLRQFRLNRTDNLKVLDETWTHEDGHSKAFVDPFEWARPTPATIPITMLVGPSAKNHLVEMCPESRKHLSSNGKDQWLLDADVHDLTPIKKFCQEYMSTITVFAPDELKKALGLEVSSSDSQSSEAAPDDTAVSEIDETAYATEKEEVHECGFKGMLKKIGDAIREYLREWRSHGVDEEAKTSSSFATNMAS